MSTTNAPAYCEVADVQEALQESDASMGTGPLSDANVEAAIFAASRWLRSRAQSHWYDSNAQASDLIDTSAVTLTGATLSVPSSPHNQRGQLFSSLDTGGPRQYPNTHAGPYVRVELPRHHVDSIDVLEVRDLGGEVTDWVADADISSGRGEDYYLDTRGGALGRSYLYIHAGTLGPRIHFEDVLVVDVSYGRDWDDAPWDDVRRGVAQLAAAEVLSDDEVLSQLPDNGRAPNVETEVQQYVTRAMDQPGYLSTFVASHPVA